MSRPRLDIALPVYHGNLQEIEPSLGRLAEFCHRELSAWDWRIVLAVNGPAAEEVIALARRLGRMEPRIHHVYTPQAGKGSGVIHAWSVSRAELVSYMDIDLSTGLAEFPELLRRIEGGAHFAIGSRCKQGARVRRSWWRWLVSICYHRLFLRYFMGVDGFQDAQCGFKAVRRDALVQLLPLVRNRNWYFESELLYIAWRKGYRIEEVAVDWSESAFSGVAVYRAAREFLRCSLELRFRRF